MRKELIVKMTLIVSLIIILLCGCKKDNADNLKINGEQINTLQTTHSAASIENQVNESIPEDAVILKWAHSDVWSVSRSVANLNRTLTKMGYKYRIEEVILPDSEYAELVGDCGADIVSTGLAKEGDVFQPAVENIKAGKYHALDEALMDSKLKDTLPKMVWESVRIYEHISCVPNAVFPDQGVSVLFNKNKYSEADIKNYDGTLDSLLSLITQDKKLYIASFDFDYLDIYGIPTGLYGVSRTDGVINNTMKNETNCQWLSALNKLYAEGKLVLPEDFSKIDECGIIITLAGDSYAPDDYYIFSYKGELNPKFAMATAILDSSERKNEAFELIELIRIVPELGMAALYDGNCAVVDGEVVNPDTNEKKMPDFMAKLVFGINDVVPGNGSEAFWFESFEQRDRYYQDNISETDMFYWYYPEQMASLMKIYKKHERLITNTENFEEELYEWQCEIDAEIVSIENEMES